MKKLVALMLVFGMVSVASAGLQLSVNGNPDPIDTEIELLPSETLELDIWTDADIGMFAGHLWMCVVKTTQGTITGGAGTITASVVSGPAPSTGVIPPAGMEGRWGNVFNLESTPIAAGTIIVDSLIFHCETERLDAVVELWEVIEDVGTGVLYDSVIIHQIPEPATMALLSLGGLFLLRRRK
jgi:hypothetical protein